jgi:hypothetical protein
MKTLTEEKFDELFNLIDNKIDLNAPFDGKMFETYGPELAFVQQMAKQNRVITIIESDEAEEGDVVIPMMCYVSGYHLVNRIGYLITDTPINFEFECILD